MYSFTCLLDMSPLREETYKETCKTYVICLLYLIAIHTCKEEYVCSPYVSLNTKKTCLLYHMSLSYMYSLYMSPLFSYRE